MRPGFIVLDKPIGLRSAYCVDRVRSILGRSIRVGHGGTLDSSASGVLVLLIGAATRLSELVMDTGKVYRASVRLGVETSTCDKTGDVLSRRDADHISEAMIDEVVCSMIGWREQVPPKVSAVHSNGRRAHECARAGEDIELAPRPVFIKKIERLSDISSDRTFDIRVECGRGTYIRSIARDLGRMLGVGAHLSALVRERSGAFDISDALTVDEELCLDRAALVDRIVHPEILTRSFASYSCAGDEEAMLRNGREVEISRLERRSFGKVSSMIAVGTALLSVGRVDLAGPHPTFVPCVNISLEDDRK